MLKGNKGEWSEIYVFLKLLADGKLYSADENLEIIENIYYPIIKILRTETENKRDYFINGDIEIFDAENETLLMKIPVIDFVENSKKLFNYLKSSSGISFSFLDIESFLESIDVKNLTGLKTDKSDIRILVHDFNTHRKEKLGFSIKSMIGKDSTLFNPAVGTNFIYKISHPENKKIDISAFNRETLLKSKENSKLSKINIRINELLKLGYQINFEKIQSENLELNLILIDSQLPLILSKILMYKYSLSVSNTKDLIELIKQKNPLNFNLSKGHPFYENKIKNFLTESALGMTPETVWNGIYDATGGIIIVKSSGDLVCYHIYNRNEFQNYLVNNTKLEQASTGENEENPGFARTDKKTKPFKFGWLYEENGEYFLKLNLQIRFTNSK